MDLTPGTCGDRASVGRGAQGIRAAPPSVPCSTSSSALSALGAQGCPVASHLGCRGLESAGVGAAEEGEKHQRCSSDKGHPFPESVSLALPRSPQEGEAVRQAGFTCGPAPRTGGPLSQLLNPAQPQFPLPHNACWCSERRKRRRRPQNPGLREKLGGGQLPSAGENTAAQSAGELAQGHRVRGGAGARA